MSLTPEQAAHPRFAELVDIFRQAEIEVAAQSRQLFGRWKTGTKKASASPSEAKNLLKTNGKIKSNHPKADNPLKTNTVIHYPLISMKIKVVTRQYGLVLMPQLSLPRRHHPIPPSPGGRASESRRDYPISGFFSLTPPCAQP